MAQVSASLRRILPWAISLIALLYVFGYATDWERLLEATRGADLVLFVTITTLDKLVFFFVWAMLQAEAIRRFVTPVSVRSVLAIRGGSELFRAVSNPLADAAFLIGISQLTRGQIPAVAVAALVPFVTHLLVLLAQATAALPFLHDNEGANRAVLLTALVGWALVGAVGLALRHASLLRVPGLKQAVAWLRSMPIRQFSPFFGWFIFLAVFDVAIQGFASRAFGVEIGWVELAARIPVLYLALSIPSVGNFGVREFTWAGLFAEFGEKDALFAYAFATNSIFLLINVAIGVLFFRRALELVAEVRRTRRVGAPLPEPLLHDSLDG